MDTEMSAVAPNTNRPSAGSHQTLDNASHLTSTPAEFNNLVCEICRKAFTTGHARRRHLRLHTGERRYACHYPGCTKNFSRRDHLRNHFITHARYRQHTFAAPLASGSVQVRHAAGAARKDAEQDDTLQNTNEILVERQKAILAGGLPCHHCEQVFDCADSRRLHTITHTGDKRYICHVSDCNMPFSRLEHVQMHLKLHVGPGRSFDELREAQLAFVPPPALDIATIQNNIRAVDYDSETSESSLENAAWHIGRGQIMCTHKGCGRSFDRQEGLSAHLRVHQPSGGPFKCPTCGKGLSRKDKLTTHMRRHEEEDNTEMPPQAILGHRSHFVCHVCGYKTGREHDLKRHLARDAHETDVFVNTDGRGYHVKRDRRQTIDLSRNGLLEGKEYTGEERDDENAGQTELEGDQDDGDEYDSIEDLFHQIVAAARPEWTGDACKDEQSTTGAFTADLSTGKSSAPIQVTGSTDDRITDSKPCQVAGSARTADHMLSRSTVSAKPATVSARDTNVAKLGGPTRTPTGAQVSQQSHPKPSASHSIASALQRSRLCYGCGHVFWDAKIFWSHGPCFTTTAASNACDLPNRAGRTSASTKADVKQQPIEHSATEEKHGSGRGAMHNINIPTSSYDELEAIVNVAPSSEVQRLLVSLVMSNPEARPIPPAELHRFLVAEPSMLDRVARMKLDNAELLDWFKKKHAERLPERQATRTAETGPPPLRNQMSWTCLVKPKTMATILCYTKPGEDLDWTKTTDRVERTRLQNVIKTRQKKEARLNKQGRAESGGDYPGVAGVHRILSQISPSSVQPTDQQSARPDELKRKPDIDTRQDQVSRKEPRNHTVVRLMPHAVLTTASGLRLMDITISDRERLIEDDVP